MIMQSSIDGHLACFHFLAIVNRAAVNICVQVFVRAPVLNSFRYIPRNGVAGSYGSYMFNLRNCQTIFYRD